MFRFSPPRHSEGKDLDTARLAQLSTAMAAACLFMIFVPPIFMAGFMMLADTHSIATSFNLPSSIIESDLLLWQRIASSFVIEIPVVLVSIGMWEARKCFLAFAHGVMFTKPAARGLRRFAAFMLAATVVEVLLVPVMSVLLTANNLGSRTLTLSLGSEHLLMLPRIAMMWLLAAIIGRGQGVVEAVPPSVGT